MNPILEPPLIQGEVISYKPGDKTGLITYIAGGRKGRIDFKREQIMGARDPVEGDRVEFELLPPQHNAFQEKYEVIVRNIRIISTKGKTKQNESTKTLSKKSSILPQIPSKKQSAFKKGKVTPTKPSAAPSREKIPLQSNSGQSSLIYEANLAQEFYRTAVIARAERRFDDARVCFRQALNAGGGQSIYKAFVEMLVDIGDTKEARQVIQQAINAFPNSNADFYMQYGRLEEDKENYVEARRVIQEGLNQNPSSQKLKKFLKRLEIFTKPQTVVSDRVQGKGGKPVRSVRQSVPNPYISEGAVENPTMFFGRQEILTDILNNIHATNFAIFGPKRIGKTSLLHQIDYHLSHPVEAQFDYLPLLVSLHAVPEERFFRALMRKIVAVLKAKERYPAESLSLLVSQTQPTDELYDEISFQEDLFVLRKALKAQRDLPLRLVLLVDEGDVLNHYRQETLAELRSIFMVWAGGYLKIVLTAEAKDNRVWQLSGSPWFSIFGKQYQLTPFTPAEARTLIVKPVPYRYQPEAIELILERSQLVPRHIQNICRQAVAEMLLRKNYFITRQYVEVALNKVDNLPEVSDIGMPVDASYALDESSPQQNLAESKAPYQTTTPDEVEP